MNVHRPLLGLGAILISTTAFAGPPAAMQFAGRGTQIYSCQAAAGRYAWYLKGPDAHLYDADGKSVARHYFGPHWQANDGSTIKGIVLDVNASPQAHHGNVSWLILRAIVQKGDGIFGHVNFVTRTDTKGGGVPHKPCDASQAGQQDAVPYTATYTFFSSPPGAAAGN